MRARTLYASALGLGATALAHLAWRRYNAPARRTGVYIQTRNGLIIDE